MNSTFFKDLKSFNKLLMHLFYYQQNCRICYSMFIFFSTFTISISYNYFLTALFNFYTATTTILRLKMRNITQYISGIYRSLFLGIAITALWKNYDCNLRFICKQKKICLSIKFLQTKASAVLHEPRNLLKKKIIKKSKNFTMVQYRERLLD